MARIQILELPTEHHGDDMTTPYILVIDQAPTDGDTYDAFHRDLEGQKDIAERIGARAILCFTETIDLPANTVEVGEQTYPVTFKVLPDFTEFRAQVASELRATQARLSTHIRAQADEELRTAVRRVAQTKHSAEPTPRPTREGAEQGHPDGTTGQR